MVYFTDIFWPSLVVFVVAVVVDVWVVPGEVGVLINWAYPIWDFLVDYYLWFGIIVGFFFLVKLVQSHFWAKWDAQEAKADDAAAIDMSDVADDDVPDLSDVEEDELTQFFNQSTLFGKPQPTDSGFFALAACGGSLTQTGTWNSNDPVKGGALPRTPSEESDTGKTPMKRSNTGLSDASESSKTGFSRQRQIAEDFLRDCDFLKLMLTTAGHRECLEFLLRCVTVRRFSPGEFCIRKAQPRDAFILIRSGKFEILSESESQRTGGQSSFSSSADGDPLPQEDFGRDDLRHKILLHTGDTMVGLLFAVGALTRAVKENLQHSSNVRCIEEGEIYVLRVDVLREAFLLFPNTMHGLVRHLLAQLMAVVGTLHKYFGLSIELLRTGDPGEDEVGVDWTEFASVAEENAVAETLRTANGDPKCTPTTTTTNLVIDTTMTDTRAADANKSGRAKSSDMNEQYEHYVRRLNSRKEQALKPLRTSLRWHKDVIAEHGNDARYLAAARLNLPEADCLDAKKVRFIEKKAGEIVTECYRATNDLLILIEGCCDSFLPMKGKSKTRNATNGETKHTKISGKNRSPTPTTKPTTDKLDKTTSGQSMHSATSNSSNLKGGAASCNGSAAAAGSTGEGANDAKENSTTTAPSSRTMQQTKAAFVLSVPGELMGHMALLAGLPQYTYYRCRQNCRFIVVDRSEVERLFVEYPMIVGLNLLQAIIPKVKPSLHRIEAAVDGRMVAGRKLIYKEGESSERGFYLVSHGRVVLCKEHADRNAPVNLNNGDVLPEELFAGDRGNRYAQGRSASVQMDPRLNIESKFSSFRLMDKRKRYFEGGKPMDASVCKLPQLQVWLDTVTTGGICGEMESFGNTPYSCTAYAARDSYLVRINRSMLQLLAQEYPHSILYFTTKMLGKKMSILSRVESTSASTNMQNQLMFPPGEEEISVHKSAVLYDARSSLKRFIPFQTDFENVTARTMKVLQAVKGSIQDVKETIKDVKESIKDVKGQFEDRIRANLPGVLAEKEAEEEADDSPDLLDRRSSLPFGSSSSDRVDGSNFPARNSSVKPIPSPPVVERKPLPGPGSCGQWPRMTTICFIPSNQYLKEHGGNALLKSIQKVRTCSKVDGFDDVLIPSLYSSMIPRIASRMSFSPQRKTSYEPASKSPVVDGLVRGPAVDGVDLAARDRGSGPDSANEEGNLDREAWQKIAETLSDMEDMRDCVLYVADPTPTDWTKMCLRNADLVLVSILVRKSDTHPNPVAGSSELFALKHIRRHIPLEFILFHDESRSTIDHDLQETDSKKRKNDSKERPQQIFVNSCGGMESSESDSSPVTSPVSSSLKADGTPSSLAETISPFVLESDSQTTREADSKRTTGQEKETTGKGKKTSKGKKRNGNAKSTGMSLKKEAEKWVTGIYLQTDSTQPNIVSSVVNFGTVDASLDRLTFSSREDMESPGVRNAFKALVERRSSLLKDLKPNFSTRHYLRPRIIRLRKYGQTSMRRWYHVRLNEKLGYDLDRCARIVHDIGIAIVLGGGGAKGLAHFGVIKALEELQVPVDIICGTSIGSFAGGIAALYPDLEVMMKKAENTMNVQFTRSKMYSDLTPPILSYFAGNFHNNLMKSTFARVHIEDLLIPFACVSVDVLNCEEVVHSSDQLWRAVRASMSLVGFVPPFPGEIDIETGKVKSLLVDGCYCQNLPIQTAKNLGAGFIITVDVAALYSHFDSDYGDTCSGWGLLWKKYFGDARYLPTSTTITDRILNMWNVMRNKEGFALVDMPLRPPIDKYSILDFHKFSELSKLGYEYAKPLLADFLENTERGEMLQGLLALDVARNHVGNDGSSKADRKEATQLLRKNPMSTAEALGVQCRTSYREWRINGMKQARKFMQMQGEKLMQGKTD